MSEDTQPDQDLAGFLAERDVACADCSHNLRGVDGAACPECGRSLCLDDVREWVEAPETFGTVFRKLGPAGWVAIIAATMPVAGGFVLLGSLGVVAPWLRGHEFAGVALYSSAFVVLAGFALLPTYAQAVLGGWAFGFWVGFPAALLGFFGASLIGYEVGRRASGDRALSLLDEHPKWRAVRDALVGGEQGAGFFRTLGIVTLIRLPPNSPFAITNIVLSSVRVPRLPYALGTLFGMAPRTGVAVFLANAVRSEIQGGAFDADSIEKPWWFWPGAIGASIAVFAILYLIGSRAIARIASSESKADRPAATEP